MYPIIERDWVAIIGSRDYPSQESVELFIKELPRTSVIITGAWWRSTATQPTRGVDEWAARAASFQGHIVILVSGSPRDGNLAGKVRNSEIIRHATRVVAFWDGQSHGTRGGFDIAEYFKIPLTVFGPAGQLLPGPPY